MTAGRTTVRRLPEKQVHDAEVLHAILDAAYVAQVGIAVDGQPFVLPMACGRDGDHLLLHGSTGSRLMRSLAATEGIGTFVAPANTLAIVLVAAIVAGVLAAVRPARRAAKLDVLDAIATT